MKELTSEQKTRESLYYQLRTCIRQALGENEYNIQALFQPLWIHFTDFYGSYDIEALIENGFLQFDLFLKYIPDGTWRDQFPPIAYRLTEKGRMVFDHPSPYVYANEVKV